MMKSHFEHFQTFKLTRALILFIKIFLHKYRYKYKYKYNTHEHPSDLLSEHPVDIKIEKASKQVSK